MDIISLWLKWLHNQNISSARFSKQIFFLNFCTKKNPKKPKHKNIKSVAS